MDFFKMDFFKVDFFQNGFFQKWIFSKWIFPKSWFFKNDFLKLHFSKMFFFFQKLFFDLIFLGRKRQKSFRGQSFVLPGSTKKGVCYILAIFFLSWVCSAILAQLIYRFCGAIYRTGTAQRHDFDDHRGNDFDDHRSLNIFCTGTALL